MNAPFKHNLIVIRALRDDAAGVWVATSDDVPGLVAEAGTLEALTEKLPGIISDLLELNGITSDLPDIPVQIIAEQSMRVANRKAP